MSFQERVYETCVQAFGQEVTDDIPERIRRVLEETLEMLQAAGCTKETADAMVEHVFTTKEPGDLHMETGGAQTTIAAFCGALGIDMEQAREDDLRHFNNNIDKIRERQRMKPVV